MRNTPTAVTLTIRDLRVRAIDIPLRQSIQTASGTVRTSPVVLIDVFTDEGPIGSAYVFCYTPLVLDPLVRLLSNLAEVLRGSAADPSQLHQMLEHRFRLLGATGLLGMAIAGIDMAAWDAAGKALNVSLATLLGGSLRPIPAYAPLRSMQPEVAAAEAAEAAEAGFSAVKVKVGHPTVQEDLALVRAVRHAVGSDIALMADYNQSLTVREAIRRGHVLDGEGLTWIEEPVRADDDMGHAEIKAAIQTPIQLGENWWGAYDMKRSEAATAFDYATFDAARIGGVTGWLEAAALAKQGGYPVSSHRYPEVSSALLAATPNSHWLEYVDTVSPVLEQPLRIHRGRALVSSEPGLGLTWNERAVERFLVP